VGVITPGRRIPAHHRPWLVFRDGALVDAPPALERLDPLERSVRTDRSWDNPPFAHQPHVG
jgi:hypothetical protein